MSDVIRAAEGVVLEPGEYEVVEIAAWEDHDPERRRVGSTVRVLGKYKCTLSDHGYRWVLGRTLVTAVRRVEPVAPVPERRMSAPKVLGVSMVAGSSTGSRRTHWIVSFGPLPVMLDPCIICETFTDSDVWDARVGTDIVARNETLSDCISAIERELLAIREAIPVTPPCSRCGKRHSSTTEAEECLEAAERKEER